MITASRMSRSPVAPASSFRPVIVRVYVPVHARHVRRALLLDGRVPLGEALHRPQPLYSTPGALDDAGNVYLTGQFQGGVDFGGGPITTAGNMDVYLVSFAP
jgi:hypothetical protein